MRSILSAIFTPIVLTVLMYPTWIGTHRPAFRDVSHFYLPLYDYVAQRCDESWLPLWNPLDQTGVPLVGETTTAVMYPVRYAIFSLPVSVEHAMNLYLFFHLILASLFAWWLARCVGASRMSATVAAMTYTLSGGVFALACNPPFLVGAAWVPCLFCVFLADGTRSIRRRTAIASFAMTMMVLGGDPQAALHVCLISGIVVIVRWWKRHSSDADPLIAVDSLKVLLASTLLAAGMSAVQISASLDWSRQSDRVVSVGDDDWKLPPVRDSVRANAYEFSLAPWHALELLTPRPFGELFPLNQRISPVIPGDGRMWTPSLYLGLLGLIAWMTRMLQWKRRGFEVWSVLALVSLLMCGGQFGVVWIIQQFTSSIEHLDSAIGGPFWFLHQFVPGYSSFRYPCKWLPIFSIACAVVTARWFDRLQISPRCWIETRRVFFMVGLVLLACLIGVGFVRWFGLGWLESRSRLTDFFWGPLDAEGSLDAILQSLIHSLICFTILYFFLRWLAPRTDTIQQRSSMTSKQRWAAFAVTLCLTIDLSLSAHTMLPRVSITQEIALAEQAGLANPPANSLATHFWLRMQDGGWPDEWKNSGSELRCAEVAASERAAWFGRWHLADRQAVFNNMTSIRSQHSASFWDAVNQARRTSEKSREQTVWPSIRKWLGIDGIHHSGRDSVHVEQDGDTYHLVKITGVIDSQPERLRTYIDWSVTDSVRHDALAQTVVRRVIESDGDPLPLVIASHRDVPSPQGSRSTPPQVSIDADAWLVTTQQNTLCVRTVFQDGNWAATITSTDDATETRSIEVYNVDGLKQGCLIPPGKWRLEFLYRPVWLWPSVGVSFIGWMLFLVVGFCGKSLKGNARANAIQCRSFVVNSTDGRFWG